jgi:hypothetical protein
MSTPISFSIRGKWNLETLFQTNTENNSNNRGFLCNLDRIGIFILAVGKVVVALSFKSLETHFDMSENDLLCEDRDILFKRDYNMFSEKQMIDHLTVSRSQAYLTIISHDTAQENCSNLAIFSLLLLLDGKTWEESCLFRHCYAKPSVCCEWLYDDDKMTKESVALSINKIVLFFSVDNNVVEPVKEVSMDGQIKLMAWNASNKQLLLIQDQSTIVILNQANKKILCRYSPWTDSDSYGKSSSSAITYSVHCTLLSVTVLI